jgi:hypothetical protein
MFILHKSKILKLLSCKKSLLKILNFIQNLKSLALKKFRFLGKSVFKNKKIEKKKVRTK